MGGLLALMLLGTLVWEAERGRKLRKQPPASVVAANPLEITLLPEFKISALQERKETVDRPLFVPTRRPAPQTDAAEKEPSRIERGLFVLSGTALQGQTRIAFLRNAKDNKPKTVRVGDVVEGMNVAVITTDKVVLTAGGQEEELLLKVAAGPKGAMTPAAAPQQQQQGQQAQQGQQVQQGQQAQTGQPVVRPSSRRARRQTAPAPGTGAASPEGVQTQPAGQMSVEDLNRITNERAQAARGRGQ
jgi:hypothetical protein